MSLTLEIFCNQAIEMKIEKTNIPDAIRSVLNSDSDCSWKENKIREKNTEREKRRSQTFYLAFPFVLFEQNLNMSSTCYTCKKGDDEIENLQETAENQEHWVNQRLRLPERKQRVDAKIWRMIFDT
jgi:hypothetical protein